MTWRCGLRPIDDVVGGGDKPGANHYMLPSLSGFVRRSASLSRLSGTVSLQLHCLQPVLLPRHSKPRLGPLHGAAT